MLTPVRRDFIRHAASVASRIGLDARRPLLAVMLALAGCSGAPDGWVRADLFVGGVGGYKVYRIPAATMTNRGTVLAFCEGRKNGGSDTGDIDLLARRSVDGGRTWQPAQVVWDDGPNTCGNPCVVNDRITGTVWLLSTWNRGEDRESAIIAGKSRDTRRVFALRSEDDGLTWSKPVEITATVKRADWTWYATGPGAGIRLERGSRAGRLVVPCDHIEAALPHRYFSHVIFSDDHGVSWQLGGRTPVDQVNECEVAELADGRLMLNMRNYDATRRLRQVALSDDGGVTWRDQRHDPALPEPICQASFRRLSWPTDGRPGVLLFANPADSKARRKLVVRASLDDGATWPRFKVIDPAGAAYSCLVTLDVARGDFACFYEGEAYARLTWARLNLDDLGADAPLEGNR